MIGEVEYDVESNSLMSNHACVEMLSNLLDLPKSTEIYRVHLRILEFKVLLSSKSHFSRFPCYVCRIHALHSSMRMLMVAVTPF